MSIELKNQASSTKQICGVAIKQIGLILLLTPCGLGNSEQCGILARPLFSIDPMTSRSYGQQCGSSLCLKRTMYLSSVRITLSVKVKFLARLVKSTTETYSLLMEVYGDECLSCTQVIVWFKRFEEGRGKIEDNLRPGWPCMSKTGATFKKSVKLFEKITA
jgi:hypothetical protein